MTMATVTLGMIVTAALGCILAMFKSNVPRCPECGSLSVTNLNNLPFQVCEQCQAIWRI